MAAMERLAAQRALLVAGDLVTSTIAAGSVLLRSTACV
jgi:hypothetical protein